MKIYQVIEKMFYVKDGVDYQVADAMEPISTYSNNKKAQEAYRKCVKYYKKLGYEYSNTAYENLFPIQHIELKSNLRYRRVVIYILVSEVK